MKKAILCILSALLLGSLFGAVGCKPKEDEGKENPDGDIGVHMHELGEWLIDGTSHWKTCSKCGQVFEKAEHTADSFTVTETEHSKTCSVCGKTYLTAPHEYLDGKCVCGKDEPEKHVHFSETYLYDVKSHWKVCDDCGETFDIAPHGEVCDCGIVTRETEGLTYISDGAAGYFVSGGGDEGETELYIPSFRNEKPVTGISENAFQSRTNLIKVVCGINFSIFARNSFRGCTALESLEILKPEGIQQVGEFAFYNCSALSGFAECRNLTEIGGSAFYGCAKIESFHFSEDLRTLGDSAFEGCEGLTEIKLPEIERIASSLFRNCKNLASAPIPASVKEIGDYAFENCALKEAVLPPELQKVGKKVFEGCKEIPEIYLPDTVIEVGYNAFHDTAYFDNAENWTGDALYNNKILIKVKPSYQGEFTVADGTRFIAGGALLVCTGITKVNIPSSVTSIGEESFGGCNGLTEVELPASITTMGTSAFHDCEELETFSTGDGIEEISMFAFSRCKKLKSVTFGFNVKSIGEQAFLDCEALESITFPQNLEKIGKKAFLGSGLKRAFFENSKRWGVSDNPLSAATTLDVSVPEDNARFLTDNYLYADSEWTKRD